ncbi:TPA: hypothetical protein KIA93_000294 [Salmonella enterica]|uniref:hypothetical protein n=1 Tax=Salmonella enterica TaxID=28901 RepID=UPI0009B03EC4|nr:hypothetical protein [Salmonella enterica]HBD1844088.1 hypothetical protein [Salmonella enterica]
MLRFHGKNLKAVLTEAISRNKLVMLTSEPDAIFLSVQDAERFGEASGHEGRIRHLAFADGCHPNENQGWAKLSSMLTDSSFFTKPISLTEGAMWEILTKNYQLSLLLSKDNIEVSSGDRNYVPVATYRDLTDRMRVTAVEHFCACCSRDELKHWRMTALKLMQTVRLMACRHATQHDNCQFLMAAHTLNLRIECVSLDGALLITD